MGTSMHRQPHLYGSTNPGNIQVGHHGSTIFVPGIWNDEQFITRLAHVQCENFGEFTRTG